MLKPCAAIVLATQVALSAPIAVGAPAAAAPWVLVGPVNQALIDVPFQPRALSASGITVYDPQALMQYVLTHSAAGPHPHSARGVAELIELVYREDGYLLAEVAMHASADAGTVHWQVMEGQLDAVRISGVTDADAARTIEAYLVPLTRSAVLTRQSLERAMMLAGDLAGIALNYRLAPSVSGPGTTLWVEASQATRRSSVNLDWIPMRPGYTRRLSYLDERYSVFQTGDLLRLQAMATREAQGGSALLGNMFYRKPLGSDGDYVEAILGNGRSSRGLSNTPERLELRGANAIVAWGRPLARSLHHHRYLIGALEHTEARMRQGVNEPRSAATVARLYWVEGRNETTGRLAQINWVASVGRRPDSRAGQADDGAKHFAHMRAGLGMAGPWSAGETALTYRFESALQWTPDALPMVEKFALGHYPFLRGYAPAEVAGDRGIAATLEVARHGSVREGISAIKPFAFVAAGRVSSVATGVAPAFNAWTLASAGIGVRLPIDRLNLETWIASPLRKGPLSDRGAAAFYLSLGTQW